MTCAHNQTVEVVPVGSDEVVARLCVQCHDRLPIQWGCPDCEFESVYVMEFLDPVSHVLAYPCGKNHSESVR